MASSCSKLLDFMSIIGRLKTTKRTGWVYNNVKQPESVSDHMYRMSILAFLVEDPTVDKNKCIKMSLVHDMAESIVGDIAPADGITKEDKYQREKSAMQHIQSLLDKENGLEMYNLWEEYEEEKSKEALFVKDLDKFEMILQAFEYEKAEARFGTLQEFFDSTQGIFTSKQVQEWAKELCERRAETGESKAK